MLGLLAAVALITLLCLVVSTLMRTLVAGIRGEEPPMRVLRPLSRRVTVKVEMLDVDHQYRELSSR